MTRRLFGDQATSSDIWFARASPVRQYMPLPLDRTAPSERRINKLSTVNQLSAFSSGGSVGERPGARHANARRLEGDVVPSTTRAAPGPWPQVMTPAWSETHGPVSAPTGDAGAKTRSQSAASKSQPSASPWLLRFPRLARAALFSEPPTSYTPRSPA